MIVRFGGGNSGIAEYLEHGAKHDRHYSREELDNRIIIDGDLDVTDTIINSIADKGQERYLHITLSFNEPDITPEKMQAAYEDYKSQFLTAYQDDELNTYAEIHWPKTQQILNRSTGELVQRHPHIHMVIPKQNLLTGGYANPQGLHEKNINIWDAIQEDVNNKHGLKSPAHSPRVSVDNYMAVLSRHKSKEFKRTPAGEMKRAVFEQVENSDCRTWQEFKDIVSEHGELKVRNQGKPNEYLAVRLPDNQRFTNLNNPVFSRQFIEKREIPHEPLTQYQIDNRLKQWEQISREIKYIEDAGPKIKSQYKKLDDSEKAEFLNQREAAFYERYDIPEPEPETVKQRPGSFEFAGALATEERSLHELPTLNMVHNGPAGHIVPGIDLLLPADESDQLSVHEAGGDTGLQGAVSDVRLIERISVKSVAGQIVFDIQQNERMSKAQELERFREIRLNLNPELVLAYAQANYLIDPDNHKISTAKDGSARISYGKYNYNVSDFFTKGLGVEWDETKDILNTLYDAQQSNHIYTKPVANDTLKQHLKRFDDLYLDRVAKHKSESNFLRRKERDEVAELNRQYFANLRAIREKPIAPAEKTKLRALETFHRLVAEEELKAGFFSAHKKLDERVYPFSDKFREYLSDQKVIDMPTIAEMKERYLNRGNRGLDEEQQQENAVNSFGSGKPFGTVTTSAEAARRARLMAQMQNTGKPHTQYGYSFKDLTPEQKKESVVFSHQSEPLFEVKSDRTEVLGDLSQDKVTTALRYSLARYGNPLEINGTNEFREAVVDAAARNEIKVEFSDPVMNDMLSRRIQELAMEQQATGNTFSATNLELDKDLPEAEAVDKALRESKEREIEQDIKSITPESLDLAQVSIQQRRNVHEVEPVTAETAELDAALFNELQRTPAMQAHFAQDMAKLAMTNPDYNAKLAELGVQSEVQLASHGAMKFESELADLYSGEDFNWAYADFTVHVNDMINELEGAKQEQQTVEAIHLPSPDYIDKQLPDEVAQPHEPRSDFERQAVDVIVNRVNVEGFDKVEFSPVAILADIDDPYGPVENHGPATLSRNDNGGWTVTATRYEHHGWSNYSFEADTLEQAAANFVDVAAPGDAIGGDRLSNDVKLQLLDEQLDAGRGVVNGIEFNRIGRDLDNDLSKAGDDIDFMLDISALRPNQYGQHEFVFDKTKLSMASFDGQWEVNSSAAPEAVEIYSTQTAAAERMVQMIYTEVGYERFKQFSRELAHEKVAFTPVEIEMTAIKSPGPHVEREQPQEAAVPGPEIKHFRLDDPRYDSVAIKTEVAEMIEHAEAAGATRFQAVTVEREVMQVSKNESGTWIRDDGHDYSAEMSQQREQLDISLSEQKQFESNIIDRLNAGDFELDENLDLQDIQKINNTLSAMLPVNTDNEFWQRHEQKFNELREMPGVLPNENGLAVLVRNYDDGIEQVANVEQKLNAELDQFKQDNPQIVEAAQNLERIPELDQEVKTDPAKEPDIEKAFTDEHKTKLVLNLYNDTLEAVKQDRPDSRQEIQELTAAASARIDQIKSRGLDSPSNRDHTQARRDMAKPIERQLTPENVKYKAKAADMSKLQTTQDPEKARVQAIKAISTLQELKGRPEVREAAEATAKLAAASPAFSAAFEQETQRLSADYAANAVKAIQTDMVQGQPQAKIKGSDFDM